MLTLKKRCEIVIEEDYVLYLLRYLDTNGFGTEFNIRLSRIGTKGVVILSAKLRKHQLNTLVQKLRCWVFGNHVISYQEG